MGAGWGGGAHAEAEEGNKRADDVCAVDRFLGPSVELWNPGGRGAGYYEQGSGSVSFFFSAIRLLHMFLLHTCGCAICGREQDGIERER